MPTQDFSSLIAIGKITRAHGVRGEVVVHMQTESDTLFCGTVMVGQSASSHALRSIPIKATRRHHGYLLVTFEGIHTKDDADTLRNLEIYVPRHALPPLDEDEAYLIDLLDLPVYLQTDDQPKLLGTLCNIVAPAGQELWTICTDTGQEILFPAVPEFVVDIDLEKEYILIAPPPGLLELYLGHD